MSLEQDTRNFLADPENLSAAQRLVASLCREVNTAQCDALVSMADTSAKTWRAILEAVVAFDGALRPLLIPALQRILREWPVGSRPLPRWPENSPRLNLLNLINTKAIELVDCAKEWALIELSTLEGIEDFSTFEIALRKVTNTGFTPRYMFNESRLKLGIERTTKFLEVRNIQSLTLSSYFCVKAIKAAYESFEAQGKLSELLFLRSEDCSLEFFSKLKSSRLRIKTLRIDQCVSKVREVLSLAWPELEELQLRCFSNEAELPEFRMPKLRKLTVDFCEFSYSLIGSLMKLKANQDIDLELKCLSHFFENDQQLAALRPLIDNITELGLSRVSGKEIPRLSGVKRLRSWRFRGTSGGEFAMHVENFLQRIPNLEELLISDSLEADVLVCSRQFNKTRPKKLTCWHVLGANSSAFFGSIANSSVEELDLTLFCRNSEELSCNLAELFKSLHVSRLVLSIRCECNATVKVLIQALTYFPGIVDRLDMNSGAGAIKEILQLLKSPVMQSLREFSVDVFVDDFLSQKESLSLALPNLELIAFRGVGTEERVTMELFDCERFPALMTIIY